MSTTIVHLSDFHFGWSVDLDQIDALGELVPQLAPDAIAVSGDLTQRARHGEFQRALVLVDQLREIAPTLVVPGNHDIQWWQSVFGVRGQRPKYRKYRKYLGEDLTPSFEVPGAVLAGALTAYGFSFGALTWNPRDVTIKGHLPPGESRRLTKIFREADPVLARTVVLHHNVLPGQLSGRNGLAHWKRAHRHLVECGADLVLCGHDHQESVGQIPGSQVVVSAVGTPSLRSRGRRPTVFNVIELDRQAISVRNYRWDLNAGKYRPSDLHQFARAQRAGSQVSAGAEPAEATAG